MKMNNEEKIFFDDENITVTQARVICGGETYVISNITSVSTQVEEPNRRGWISLRVTGALIFQAPVDASSPNLSATFRCFFRNL